MEKRTQNKEQYLADIRQLAARPASPVLTKLRASGEAAVQQFDYPHSGMEAWRQTNVAPLVNQSFRSLLDAFSESIARDDLSSLLPPVAMTARVVFVDGFLQPELTILPEGYGAVVGGLAQMLEGPQGPFIASLLQDSPQPQHLFTALNTAFVQDGLFCHVPEGVQVEEPLHVVFLTSDRREQTAAHIRSLVAMESGAQMQIITHHAALPGGNPYFTTSFEDLRLGANAALQRVELVREVAGGYRMAHCNIRQARDSRVESYALTLDGGAITRNEIRAELLGTGVETQLHGLYLNGKRGLVDNDLSIAHHEPHCSSRMRYKGILSGQSHSVFTGKIFVARDAQKTDSEQLSANLMLSQQARVDAKPQLEIYADDVRCTHGVTVGGPPENEVYYLRSRGIGEATARRMLTYGFAGDVIERIPREDIRDWLTDHVRDLLRQNA